MYVADYCKRMALSKIGYSFDPKDLSQLQAAYLVEIHSNFEELKARELKKARKKGGQGGRR